MPLLRPGRWTARSSSSATQTALAGGFRLRHAFEAVAAISARVDAPLAAHDLLESGRCSTASIGSPTTWSPRAARASSPPTSIPDEAAPWIAASDRTGLDRVFLAAPSSSDERLRATIAASRGFVYAVSTMGDHGRTRTEMDEAARDAGRPAPASRAPAHACVGLGISTAAQVADVLSYADGAIVGSALVHALAEGGVAAVARKGRRARDGNSRATAG